MLPAKARRSPRRGAAAARRRARAPTVDDLAFMMSGGSLPSPRRCSASAQVFVDLATRQGLRRLEVSRSNEFFDEVEFDEGAFVIVIVDVGGGEAAAADDVDATDDDSAGALLTIAAQLKCTTAMMFATLARSRGIVLPLSTRSPPLRADWPLLRDLLPPPPPPRKRAAGTCGTPPKSSRSSSVCSLAAAVFFNGSGGSAPPPEVAHAADGLEGTLLRLPAYSGGRRSGRGRRVDGFPPRRRRQLPRVMLAASPRRSGNQRCVDGHGA